MQSVCVSWRAEQPPALISGSRDEINLEASVYAHGLHGAGFHDVVQGHIPSHQGSGGLQPGRGQPEETLPGLALSAPEGNGAWFEVIKSDSKSNLQTYTSFCLSLLLTLISNCPVVFCHLVVTHCSPFWGKSPFPGTRAATPAVSPGSAQTCPCTTKTLQTFIIPSTEGPAWAGRGWTWHSRLGGLMWGSTCTSTP